MFGSFRQSTGKPSAGRGGPTPRILVVDDSRLIRMKVSRVLRGAGFEVAVAEDGLACLETVEGYAPDLILMDLNMPEMGGLQAMRYLRAKKSVQGIPVVVLSSNAQASDRAEALAGGAHSYLVKPVSDADLVAHVRRVLAGVPAEAVPEAPPAGVLIVDDSGLIRKKVRRALGELGCRFYEAADGAEACRLAEAHRPGVILMDLNMPVMDGLEAAARILEQPALKNTTIIALSANTQQEDVDRARAVGMKEYLVKPFTAEDLLRRVRPYLASR